MRFDNLRAVHDLNPEIHIVMSESCQERQGSDPSMFQRPLAGLQQHHGRSAPCAAAFMRYLAQYCAMCEPLVGHLKPKLPQPLFGLAQRPIVVRASCAANSSAAAPCASPIPALPCEVRWACRCAAVALMAYTWPQRHEGPKRPCATFFARLRTWGTIWRGSSSDEAVDAALDPYS